MAPPSLSAMFSENVLFVMVGVAKSPAAMAPPLRRAELFMNKQFFTRWSTYPP